MRRIWRENSLSIVMFSLFFAIWIGQIITGRAEYNEDQVAHNQPPVGFGTYLTSGHFIEATFENWESEFLQMSVFVVATVFLRQKGSPESKKLQGRESVDSDPRESSERLRKDAPGPVRTGGLRLTLYEHSLSLTLFSLFLISFALHAAGGAVDYSEQQLAHGGHAVSTLEYLTTARFWFESLQNWQSEFLSIGVMVVLAIFLRERGSPESKPVAMPHYETGGD